VRSLQNDGRIPEAPFGLTALSVPAKLTNCAGSDRPSQDMNQVIDEQGGGARAQVSFSA
jgi:hypothetical protein